MPYTPDEARFVASPCGEEQVPPVLRGLGCGHQAAVLTRPRWPERKPVPPGQLGIRSVLPQVASRSEAQPEPGLPSPQPLEARQRPPPSPPASRRHGDTPRA